MDILNGIIFYIISILITIITISVILSKKIINSIFYSFIVFFLFGILFFSLNASFNAVMQIALYSSALSIIFVIEVALIDFSSEKNDKFKLKPYHIFSFAGIILLCISIIVFYRETVKYDYVFASYLDSVYKLTDFSNIYRLSSEIMKNNIYSFELTGILLLIVLIGVSVLFSLKGDK